MDNFQEPSQNFGENIIPISEIKKFTKPTAQAIAQRVHSELYPDTSAQYAEKEAFIERFIPNSTTENFGDNIPVESSNPVLDARKNNYKRWLEERL